MKCSFLIFISSEKIYMNELECVGKARPIFISRFQDINYFRYILYPFPYEYKHDSYMTHYLGELSQFIKNFEIKANFEITLTDSEIQPWSGISFYSLFIHSAQTDTVNIQVDIVNIRAPKRAQKSAYVNTRAPKRSPESASVNTNFRPVFNLKFN